MKHEDFVKMLKEKYRFTTDKTYFDVDAMLKDMWELGKQEGLRMAVDLILKESHEVYYGLNGFLQTDTDKVVLALTSLIKKEE